MTKKKLLKLIVMDLIILLLVLVVAFYFVGNSLIKSGIEAAATKTLGVAVTVKSINLSILRGQVEIKGLVVKNPPGYANETLLELGEGVVKLADFSSLMSDTIKIQLIKLDGAKLTMEQKLLSNNLKDILDKLPKTEKAATEEKGKNLNIARLEITNTNVNVKLLPVPGKSDTVSMNIDPIIMTDLGTEKKLSMGMLAAKILGAISTGIAKQGAGLLPNDMVNGLKSAIGNIPIQEGQKMLEETTKAGKGVVEGLGGLLGGKKDPNK
jgi:hypothetical protein